MHVMVHCACRCMAMLPERTSLQAVALFEAVGAASQGCARCFTCACAANGCTCREQVTCPFHVVGRVLDDTPVGSRVFPDVTPANALGVLRVVLSKLEEPLACEYRTHDLRRGHTQDLVESGLGEPFA